MESHFFQLEKLRNFFFLFRLSRHTKASAEKRKQAAIEAAKLEVLSDSNRKAYDEVLEERLRTYMKITAPVIVEVAHVP